MDGRLENLKSDLQLAVEGMSNQELGWHPPGKWCAAEVLEHLYLTYTGTILGLERVMRKGKPLVSRVTLSQRLLAFVVVRLGYIPPGRRAPAMTLPKGTPMEKLRNEIGTMMGVMDGMIAQCAARFGNRVKLLDHPLLGPLSAAEWRKLHVTHGHHHLKQIRRLRYDAARQLQNEQVSQPVV
jgi:hypothetical protein